MRQHGLVRYLGLAGAWTRIAELDTVTREIGEIVQTGEFEWPSESPPDITYGAIAKGPQSAFAPAIEATSVSERLRSALARRPQGAVVVSTTTREHLLHLARIAGTQAA